MKITNLSNLKVRFIKSDMLSAPLQGSASVFHGGFLEATWFYHLKKKNSQAQCHPLRGEKVTLSVQGLCLSSFNHPAHPTFVGLITKPLPAETDAEEKGRRRWRHLTGEPSSFTFHTETPFSLVFFYGSEWHVTPGKCWGSAARASGILAMMEWTHVKNLLFFGISEGEPSAFSDQRKTAWHTGSMFL